MAVIQQTEVSPSPSHAGKRTIYIRNSVWQQACEKADSLNLSTSQLLSQMIMETVDQIDSKSLLGLQGRKDLHHS